MALDSNSYGTVAGTAAYVKHLTNATGTFDTTTAPTLTEVEAFIDQASDVLNGYLARNRYVIPVTHADAIKVLARFANLGAAGMCELSLRSGGMTEDENNRQNAFLKLFKEAEAYIASGALAALGAGVQSTGVPPPLAGLRFGGQTRTGQALKPIFTRTGFGNDPTAENPGSEPGYTE